jgi:sporulation protein YlmC with PRC-barrel domain
MNKFVAMFMAATLVAAVPAVAGDVSIPAGIFTGSQTEEQYLARDNLIGAKVHDKDGKIIGDIEDLIINDHNQVIGVVMGTGGFLGLAEKKIGVNLSALQFDDSSGKTIVKLPEATPQVLDAVTPYQRTKPKKSLIERAKEKARELTDKTTATTQDAVEKAKPKLEQAKEKAIEAYEKAKEAAEPAIEKATEAAKEATEAVKEAIDAAKQAADEITAPADPAPQAPAEAAPAAPAEPAPAEPAVADPAEPAPADPAPAAPAESAPAPSAEEPAPAAPAEPAPQQ